MAWNDSGDGKNKDPWSNQQKPPELDELFRKLQAKFNKLFGIKDAPPSNGSGMPRGAPAGVVAILLIIGVIYLLAGIYIVKPAERAAVFRFGKFVNVVGPGPHWIPRVIQTYQIVNVDEVLTSKHQGQMLTKDENIVSVEFAVQYRVDNPADYLFNVTNSRYSLQQATDSAMRQVIGHSTLDEILTSGRAGVRQQIREQIVLILKRYHAGVMVMDVAMQPAKAPDAVKEAFDDAIKAQEDEQRLINEARAYEKRIVPVADGDARRLIAEAEAYRDRMVLDATGETERFLQVLPQYQSSPEVTRQRMYLQMMESVLSNTSKIVVDPNGGNNILYLPLDQLRNMSKFEPKPAGKLTVAPPQPVATAAPNNINYERSDRGSRPVRAARSSDEQRQPPQQQDEEYERL
jgi:membrane protease subunit HflK